MPRPAHLKLVPIACLALGVAALASAPAGARGINMYDSKVTIEDGPPAFHGKVKSDHPPCQNKRHVAVFKIRNGQDRKLGGDETGPAGRWEVEIEILASGAYYARVRQKQQIVSANGYTCDKDRSRTVVVD